jgi:two-component system sensor histidine kinase/response regulator
MKRTIKPSTIKKNKLSPPLVKKRRSTEELTSLYEAILNHAGYAMIATDVDGIITLFNPAAERMLGFSAQDLVGKKSPAIWHDPIEIKLRAQQLSQEFSKKIEPGFEVFVARSQLGLSNQQEWTYIRKDGSRISIMLAITALYNRKKQIVGFLGIASDLSVQQKMQSELQVARDELAVAIDLTQLGVWSWYPEANVLYWNDRMFDIYQQPYALRKTGLNYEHWRMRLHPDDAKTTEKKLADAILGIADYDAQFRIVLPDGQIRYIKGAAKVSRNDSGNVLSVTGMNLDITAEIAHKELMLLDKERSDMANHAKSAFIANMSHEIRTPMNAIIGLLQLLRKTALSTHQLDYVRQLQSSGENLLLIINDILDFSKIESNKLVLDLNWVDLEKILHDMTPVLSVNIGNKDIELLFNLSTDLPKCILVDGLRLQQILLNLLSNAIKFTEQGEIIFSVLPIEIKKKKVTLEFSVRDTGIGISPKQHALIFNTFSQAESSITRRFGGTGLGLTISQKLVQLMGGELCVESKPQLGSLFHFNLTCPLGTPQQCEKTNKVHHKLLSLKCLLVDDNASARKIMSDMLRSFGWMVEEASSGAKAINNIVKKDACDPFDMVYIDYRMPKLDGWATCDRIRSLKLKNPLALVLMSRIYDSNPIAQLQKDNPNIIDSYLLKPVTASSLFNCAATIYFPSVSTQPLKLDSPIIPGRLSGFRLLLVEDNLTNQVVAHDLLVSEGAHVSISENPYHVLDKIEETDPLFDVVLMDIQMPEMDGYTLTKKIRKKYSRQLLPIIAISANTFEESRAKAIKAGMNGFVCKPFRLDLPFCTVAHSFPN